MADASYVHIRGQATEYEVADVFREGWERYQTQYPVTAQQARVARDILACRTAALGGQVYECLECGAVEFAYCSCRNRHCPKCQKFAKAQWVEAQKVWHLPIPYFHVVFTTDHGINAWVPENRAAFYNLLFSAASETLKAFAAEVLGGELGLTAVLHTWSQVLLGHVHLHCIVTGGALSFDGRRWVRSEADYLFDIVAVAAAFRDRFCAGVVALAERGALAGVEVGAVKTAVAAMQAKRWEVFINPFETPAAVINYLSRYVHAVAISNYRLVAVGDGQVRFRYHDNPAGGVEKELTLTAEEFIGRFLWHILPEKFVRVRHYGLHQSTARKRRLPQARKLLGLTPAVPSVAKLVLAVWLETLLGEGQVQRCHWCGALGTLAYRGEVTQLPRVWVWLKIVFGMLLGWAWHRAYRATPVRV